MADRRRRSPEGSYRGSRNDTSRYSQNGETSTIPPQQPDRTRSPVQYSSSSGSSSSSYLDISRKHPIRAGIRAFFTAPSERRRLRRRRSAKFGKQSNSSSSSINSDLAYGTGFIKKKKVRGVRSRHGRGIDRENLGERERYRDNENRRSRDNLTEGQRFGENDPRRDIPGNDNRFNDPRRDIPGSGPRLREGDVRRDRDTAFASLATGGRGPTDEEEILRVGAGLAKLARDQNKFDLKSARSGRQPELAAFRETRHSASGATRGLNSSKLSHGPGNHGDDDWESASDTDSSVDLSLAFSNESTTGFWPWSKKKHLPQSKKSSLVDPRLFGRQNSLNGLLTEPVGFGGDVAWTSNTDFGPQNFIPSEPEGPRFPDPSSSTSQSSLRNVFPVTTSDPYRVDAERRGGSAVSTDIYHASGRPDPVPIQHPKPFTPVSQSLYDTPAVTTRSESGGILKSNQPSSRSRSTAEIALGGVGIAAGFAAVSALSNRNDDRNDKRRDEEREEERSRRKRYEEEEDRRKHREYEADQERRRRVELEQEQERRRRRELEEADERKRRRDGEKKETKDERRKERRESPDRKDKKKDKELRKSDFKGSDISRRDKKSDKPRDETREDKERRREKRREDRRSEVGDDRIENRRTKGETAVAHTSVDPFKYQVDTEVYDPAHSAVPAPEHRQVGSVPAAIVTVEREPTYVRQRSSSIKEPPTSSRSDPRLYSDYEDRERASKDREDYDSPAQRGYNEIIHSTAPLPEAAIAAGVIAVAVEGMRGSRSHERRNERRSDDGTTDYEHDDQNYPPQSNGSGRDFARDRDLVRDRVPDVKGQAIQEEADRAYREQNIARKVATQVRQERTPSLDRSLVDKYAHRDVEETVQIVTPPEMKEHENQTGLYDAPNADFKPDYIMHPRDLQTFSIPHLSLDRSNPERGYLKRDPDAEGPRPHLNLVRPTPTPSPLPEKQVDRSQTGSSSDSKNQKTTQSATSDDVVIGPRGNVVASPTASAVSKGVTWGQNETKHFDYESPHEHKDEFISNAEAESHNTTNAAKTSAGSKHRSTGWATVAAAVSAGAGVVAASSSDASSSSKSKGNVENQDVPYEYRGVIVEPENSSPRQPSPPSPGPKPSKSAYEYPTSSSYSQPPSQSVTQPFEQPSNPAYSQPHTQPYTQPYPQPHDSQTSRIPGAFDDDIEFTATVAAALQDSGFDPNTVINDASFRRRNSPPGSNDPINYQAPFAETVTDLGSYPLESTGDRGFILGEVDKTPQEWRSISPEGDDTPSKLSKKEQKRRDKVAGRQSSDATPIEEVFTHDEPNSYFDTPKLSKKEQKKRDKAAQRQDSLVEESTPTVETQIVEEPDSYSEPTKKSKKKSKKNAYSADTEENPRSVTIPVDAFNDVQVEEEEWNEPAKSKKKSKRDNERFDSPSRSIPSPEMNVEPERSSSTKSKDKSRRKSEGYEPSPSEVSLPPSTPSEASEYTEPRSSRKSNRDSNIYESADRDDSRSVVSSSRTEDEPRRKKKSRSGTKDDFDDTRSVASAPAGDEDDRKKKKDKKGGGFFGLFGSKSEVEARDESPKGSKDDFEDVKKKSKKEKRRSVPDSSGLYGGLGAQSINDLSQVGSNGHSNGSHQYDDDAGARSDGERKKTRSRAESTSSKKDSFLDNAGTPGAGVGIAVVTAAAALAAAQYHQQSKAANADSTKTTEQSHSKISRKAPKSINVFDYEVPQHDFRPSIDPQYGDLLPLPPSNPTSPNVELLDDLPDLPESRPGTPETERLNRPSVLPLRRHLMDAPTKSPSQSAVPIKFIMGNRSTPSSPGLNRSPATQSPETQHQDSLGFLRSRPTRPTSWDSTREFKPLYLVESNRRLSSTKRNEPDEILPELPPSQRTSRSSSQHEYLDVDREVEPLSFSRPGYLVDPLTIDTALASTHSDDLLDSGQSTPKAGLISRDFGDLTAQTRDAQPSDSPTLPVHKSIDTPSHMSEDEPTSLGELAPKGIAVAGLASTIGYFASSPRSVQVKDDWMDDLPSVQRHPSLVDSMSKDRSSYLLNSSPMSRRYDDESTTRDLASPTHKPKSPLVGSDLMNTTEERERGEFSDRTGDVPSFPREAPPPLPVDAAGDVTDEISFTQSKKDKKKDKKKGKGLARSLTQDESTNSEPSTPIPVEIPLAPVSEPFDEYELPKSKRDKKKGKKTRSELPLDDSPVQSKTQVIELDERKDEAPPATVESSLLDNFALPIGKKDKKKGKKNRSELSLDESSFDLKTQVTEPDESKDQVIPATAESSLLDEFALPMSRKDKKKDKKQDNKKGKSTTAWEEPVAIKSNHSFKVPEEESSQGIMEGIETSIETPAEDYLTPKNKKDKKDKKGKKDKVIAWEDVVVESAEHQMLAEDLTADEFHDAPDGLVTPVDTTQVEEFSTPQSTNDDDTARSAFSWEPQIEPEQSDPALGVQEPLPDAIPDQPRSLDTREDPFLDTPRDTPAALSSIPQEANTFEEFETSIPKKCKKKGKRPKRTLDWEDAKDDSAVTQNSSPAFEYLPEITTEPLTTTSPGILEVTSAPEVEHASPKPIESLPEVFQEAPISTDVVPVDADVLVEDDFSTPKSRKEKKKDKKSKSEPSWEAEIPVTTSEGTFTEALPESLDIPSTAADVNAENDFSTQKSKKGKKSKKAKEPSWEPANEHDLPVPSIEDGLTQDVTRATDAPFTTGNPDPTVPVDVDASDFFALPKSKKDKKKPKQLSWEEQVSEMPPLPESVPESSNENDLPVTSIEEGFTQDVIYAMDTTSTAGHPDPTVPEDVDASKLFALPKFEKDKKSKSLSWADEVSELPSLPESVPESSTEQTEASTTVSDDFILLDTKKSKKSKGKSKARDTVDLAEHIPQALQLDVVEEPLQGLATPDDSVYTDTKKNKKGKGKYKASDTIDMAKSMTPDTQQDSLDNSGHQGTATPDEFAFTELKKGKKKKNKENKFASTWEQEEVPQPVLESQEVNDTENFTSGSKKDKKKGKKSPSLGVEAAPAQDEVSEDPSNNKLLAAVGIAATAGLGASLLKANDQTSQQETESKDGLDAGYNDDQLSLARQLQEEFAAGNKKFKKDKKKRQSLPSTPDSETSRSRAIGEPSFEHSRARSLSFGPSAARHSDSPASDLRRSLYSEDKLESIRQLKDDFDTGGKKSKKDKKKRQESPFSAQNDDLGNQAFGDEPPSDLPDTGFNIGASNDLPKRDGLEAGYQESQLSLARQLQEEFGKKSKKDKKRRSTSQTPTEAEPRADYFGDIPQPAASQFAQPDGLSRAIESPKAETPALRDGLAVGYSEDQLEFARQLKEEFGSGSKKSRKDKKRKSTSQTPIESEVATPHFDEPAQPPVKDESFTQVEDNPLRDGLAVGYSEDQLELARQLKEEFGKKAKKDKKAKKRESVLRSNTEDDISSEYGSRPVEEPVGKDLTQSNIVEEQQEKTPIPEDDFATVTKKSKKDKKEKKRESMLRGNTEENLPVEPLPKDVLEYQDAVDSQQGPVDATKDFALIEPEDAAAVSKKSKKDKKSKKRDSIIPIIAETVPTDDVLHTEGSSREPETFQPVELLELTLPSSPAAEADDGSGFVAKKSKKDKKSKKRDSTIPIIAETVSTEDALHNEGSSQEPENFQPIDLLESTSPSPPAEAADGFGFAAKKSKKDKKSKKLDSSVHAQEDDVPAKTPKDMPSQPDDESAETEPVDLSPVPAEHDSAFSSKKSKKDKKGKKRDSIAEIAPEVPPLEDIGDADEALHNVPDSQPKDIELDQSEAITPAEDGWAALVTTKKPKKDRKNKKSGLSTPAELVSLIVEPVVTPDTVEVSSFGKSDSTMLNEAPHAMKKSKKDKKGKKSGLSTPAELASEPSSAFDPLTEPLNTELESTTLKDMSETQEVNNDPEVHQSGSFTTKKSKKDKKSKKSGLSTPANLVEQSAESLPNLDPHENVLSKETERALPIEAVDSAMELTADDDWTTGSGKQSKKGNKKIRQSEISTPIDEIKPVETTESAFEPSANILAPEAIPLSSPDDEWTTLLEEPSVEVEKENIVPSASSPVENIPAVIEPETSLGRIKDLSSTSDLGSSMSASTEVENEWESSSFLLKKPKKDEKKLRSSSFSTPVSEELPVVESEQDVGVSHKPEADPSSVTDPDIQATNLTNPTDTSLQESSKKTYSDDVQPIQDDFGFVRKPSKKDKKNRKSGTSTPLGQPFVTEPATAIETPDETLPAMPPLETITNETSVGTPEESSPKAEFEFSTMKSKKDKKNRKSGHSTPLGEPVSTEPATAMGTFENLIPATLPLETIANETGVEISEESFQEQEFEFSTKQSKKNKKNRKSGTSTPFESLPSTEPDAVEHTINRSPPLEPFEAPIEEVFATEPAAEQRFEISTKKSKKDKKNRKSGASTPFEAMPTTEPDAAEHTTDRSTPLDPLDPLKAPIEEPFATEPAAEQGLEISTKKSKKDKKEKFGLSTPIEPFVAEPELETSILDRSLPLKITEGTREQEPVYDAEVAPEPEHEFAVRKSRKDKKKGKPGSSTPNEAAVLASEPVMELNNAPPILVGSFGDQQGVALVQDVTPEPEFEFATKKSKKDKKKENSGFSTPFEAAHVEPEPVVISNNEPVSVESFGDQQGAGSLPDVTSKPELESAVKTLKKEKKKGKSGSTPPFETSNTEPEPVISTLDEPTTAESLTDQVVRSIDDSTYEPEFELTTKKSTKDKKRNRLSRAGSESGQSTLTSITPLAALLTAADNDTTLQVQPMINSTTQLYPEMTVKRPLEVDGQAQPITAAVVKDQEIEDPPIELSRKPSKKDKRKRQTTVDPIKDSSQPTQTSWAEEVEEAEVVRELPVIEEIAKDASLSHIASTIDAPLDDFSRPSKKGKKSKKRQSIDFSSDPRSPVNHDTKAKESGGESSDTPVLLAAGAALVGVAIGRLGNSESGKDKVGSEEVVETPSRKSSKKDKKKKIVDKRANQGNDMFDDPALWEGADPKVHEEAERGMDDDGSDGFWSPKDEQEIEMTQEPSEIGERSINDHTEPISEAPKALPAKDVVESPATVDGQVPTSGSAKEYYTSPENFTITSPNPVHQQDSSEEQGPPSRSITASELQKPPTSSNKTQSADNLFIHDSYSTPTRIDRSLAEDSPRSPFRPSSSKFALSGFSDLPAVEEESTAQVEAEQKPDHRQESPNRDSAFVSESPTPRHRQLSVHEPVRDSGIHIRDSSPLGTRGVSTSDEAISRLSWPSVNDEAETVDINKSLRYSASKKRVQELAAKHDAGGHQESPKDRKPVVATKRDLLPSQRPKEEKPTDLHRAPAVHGAANVKAESLVKQRVQRLESPDSQRADKPRLNRHDTPSLRSKSDKYADLGSHIPKADRSGIRDNILPGAALGAAALGFAAARQSSLEKRPDSAQSQRSISNVNRLRTPDPKYRPDSVGSNRSGTPPLRRTDRKISGDLRSLSQLSKPDLAKEAELAALPASSVNTANPTANEGRARAKDMADVYDGFGEGRMGSPRSPTRPHSMRRRQSMQVLELEHKVEQLAAENRLLADAHAQAERGLQTTKHASSSLVEKDAEIDALKRTLDWLQQEVTRLSEVNDGLSSANVTLGNQHNHAYGMLESQHAEVSRELQEVRESHSTLTTGMQGIIANQIQNAVEEKDREISQLRAGLDAAQEQIREMQRQILASKANDSEFLTVRDEDYFDNACQHLCQHVQQWVLRFSKFSDMRACRLTSEINNDKTIDRLDNAILDGSDVDTYLGDRIKRRDVFMSMTMTMVWEFVFTRYLFGMDREQRQKLKTLEKLLSEVGPPSAVHQWRATTLTLLSKREAFMQQREQDTQAVVHAIMETLSEILPPPSQLEGQIEDQLKRVMTSAVDLSIEMRTQRAEYMMLPPLQPEYDANGDLASKVQFNAALMNERSGDTVSNEDLEAQKAVVRIVLFPLVVKKGDDKGDGDEEIVVCPAQVLTAKQKKQVRVMAGGNASRVSMQSNMPGTEYGDGSVI